jgi:hypothetical protein
MSRWGARSLAWLSSQLHLAALLAATGFSAGVISQQRGR